MTSRAVITLVTLAIGRSVSKPRLHNTWPVRASASTAPLAFTPCGAPVTSITGPAGGRGRGRTTGARDRCAIAAACSDAGRARGPVSVAAHAAMLPPTMIAAAVTATIRTVSRMARLNPRYPRSAGLTSNDARRKAARRCHTLQVSTCGVWAEVASLRITF